MDDCRVRQDYGYSIHPVQCQAVRVRGETETSMKDMTRNPDTVRSVYLLGGLRWHAHPGQVPWAMARLP